MLVWLQAVERDGLTHFQDRVNEMLVESLVL